MTDLSHFSLLFLQGSQFIALRARLVGGRPSPFCSPGAGEVRPRTVPAVAALPAFGRGGAEVVGVGVSSAIGACRFPRLDDQRTRKKKMRRCGRIMGLAEGMGLAEAGGGLGWGNKLGERLQERPGGMRRREGRARSKPSHLAIYSNKNRIVYFFSIGPAPRKVQIHPSPPFYISAKLSVASRCLKHCTAPQSRTEEGTKYT